MRVLAVDPGLKHIGLAISDPTGAVARPLTTLRHHNRAADAENIAAQARQHGAELVVMGHALDSEGRPHESARAAARLAEALRTLVAAPVVLYDESFTSATAAAALLATGKSRRARRENIHAAAAAALLQAYLDGHSGKAAPG